MNIIITEAQYNKLTEEKIREFLYAFWDNQKKHGEEPTLDDMLYKVLGYNKNTSDDLQIIRPIWYRYNGGFEKLYKKLENEVLGKTFNLIVPEINLNTKVKVVGIDRVVGGGHQFDYLDIMIDMDGNGTVDYEFLDSETEEQRLVNGSLWDALSESQEAYETGDFFGMLNYHCYKYFYELLEKYGIPIDVEVEIGEIQIDSDNINESFFDEMSGIKAITKFWKSKLSKGEKITFNKDELEYFNITEFSPKLHAQEVFYDLMGGHDYTDKFIKELLNKTFSTEDFNERITGGYNFKWVINDFEYQDFRYKLYGEALPGGTVEMMDGRILNLDDACNHVDFGWEIQNEVNDVVKDCMKELIVPKTGAHIEVPLIIVPE